MDLPRNAHSINEGLQYTPNLPLHCGAGAKFIPFRLQLKIFEKPWKTWNFQPHLFDAYKAL